MSDLHGYLPEIDKCDLVLICGDIVSLRSQRYPKSCKKWYTRVFQPWIDSLPCDKVLFISGNHEVGMEGHEDFYKNYFGKSQVVLIQSQLGVPICAYSGDDVYWEIKEDLPKTTKLMIDGKALYIHRANFQIIDTELIQ